MQIPSLWGTGLGGPWHVETSWAGIGPVSLALAGGWISYPLRHQGRPMRTIFKDLPEFVTICSMFWFFGQEACGILTQLPGIKPLPAALEGEVLTTGSLGKSHPLTLLLAFPWYRGRDIRFWVRCGVENPVLLPGRCHIISVNLLNWILFLKIKRFHIKKI